MDRGWEATQDRAWDAPPRVVLSPTRGETKGHRPAQSAEAEWAHQSVTTAEGVRKKVQELAQSGQVLLVPDGPGTSAPRVLVVVCCTATPYPMPWEDNERRWEQRLVLFIPHTKTDNAAEQARYAWEAHMASLANCPRTLFALGTKATDDTGWLLAWIRLSWSRALAFDPRTRASVRLLTEDRVSTKRRQLVERALSGIATTHQAGARVDVLVVQAVDAGEWSLPDGCSPFTVVALTPDVPETGKRAVEFASARVPFVLVQLAADDCAALVEAVADLWAVQLLARRSGWEPLRRERLATDQRHEELWRLALFPSRIRPAEWAHVRGRVVAVLRREGQGMAPTHASLAATVAQARARRARVVVTVDPTKIAGPIGPLPAGCVPQWPPAQPGANDATLVNNRVALLAALLRCAVETMVDGAVATAAKRWVGTAGALFQH